MPKLKVKKTPSLEKTALEKQLLADPTVEAEYAAKMSRKAKAKGHRRGMGTNPFRGGEQDEGSDGEDAGEADEAFVPAKISKRILAEAREQQMDDGTADGVKKKRVRFGGAGAGGAGAGGRRQSVGGASAFTDADDDDDESLSFGAEDDVALEDGYVGVRYDAESAEDAAALARFMPEAAGQRRSLADMIMDKLKEKEAAARAGTLAGGFDEDADEDGSGGGGAMLVPRGAAGNGVAASGSQSAVAAGLDPKVVEVYTEVGKYLSHYKSGKLPKVFKVIPALSNWEEIVFLTNPETWSPHATYAATRVFASNFNPAKAHRFYNLILLPKCRDDIFAHKRLNYHLYLSLKKAVYKPEAFYRGILLPLASSGDCTLREAIIFASVLAKVSVPQLHSATALVKLAKMPYSGCISIFLKALINKKYTLPYLAIDAVVEHFVEFEMDAGPLPVIWHQCLLSLVQRYKADLTGEQKEAVRHLCGKHAHHAITPEIKRELNSAGCRGDPVSMPLPTASGGAGVATSSGGAGAGAGAGGRSRSRGAPAPAAAAAKASASSSAQRKHISGDAMDDEY